MGANDTTRGDHTEDIIDILRWYTIVPVRSTDYSGVLANVATVEAEVVGVQRSIRIHKLRDQLRDIGVEASVAARLTPQVTLELVHTASELFKDNDLRFDVTDLLQEKPSIYRWWKSQCLS